MAAVHATIGLIGPLGWGEILVIALFAVLIFGRRLPEVGRSLGRGLVEFKKGLKGVKDDVGEATREARDIASEAEAEVNSDRPKG